MAGLFLVAAVSAWALAAYLDWRQRSAPNWLWPIIAAAGALSHGVLVPAVGMAVSGTAGYLLWRGGFWGGADAKALLVLPWTLPTLWPLAMAASAALAVGGRYVGEDRGEIPYLVVLGPVAAALAAAQAF